MYLWSWGLREVREGCFEVVPAEASLGEAGSGLTRGVGRLFTAEWGAGAKARR